MKKINEEQEKSGKCRNSETLRKYQEKCKTIKETKKQKNYQKAKKNKNFKRPKKIENSISRKIYSKKQQNFSKTKIKKFTKTSKM